MELAIHETGEDAARAVAALISDAIRTTDRSFSLGLAGGSTPRPTYELLRDADLDWKNVEGWLADERWVSPESERSNGLMVSDALFDHIEARLHRPEFGPGVQPEQSAARYQEVLESLDGGTPDLVFLGLGDDGHTASLFPGSDALTETERRYAANVIPESGEVRLTATYPLLHNARIVVFLVTGDSKAIALEQSLLGATPAGRVAEGRAQVLWHVDRAAASLIS